MIQGPVLDKNLKGSMIMHDLEVGKTEASTNIIRTGFLL